MLGKDELARLRPHDEVTWTDPDARKCSGVVKILEVAFPEGLNAEDPVVRITRFDGSVLEAWASELS